jgi:hypothetical protein
MKNIFANLAKLFDDQVKKLPPKFNVCEDTWVPIGQRRDMVFSFTTGSLSVG